MARRKKGLAVNGKPRRVQTGAKVGSVHPKVGSLLPSASGIPGSSQYFSTGGEAGLVASVSGPSTMSPVVGIPGRGQGRKRRGSD